MHRLTAGAGYRYLLRNTASGDCDRSGAGGLTAYYTETGNPPGRWRGSGLAGLAGGDGVRAGALVTEEAMAHLFGAGRDPVTGLVLGRAYPVFAPATDRIRDAAARLPTSMGAVERQAAIETITKVELAKPTRTAVAGFDLTFTVAKSASTLWALAGPRTQQAVLDAHRAAVTDALTFLEDTALFTRTGTDGCAQVRTRGMIAAAFDHWDTRAGDPNLHTHVVLANKVQGPDGAWRSVDSRALHHAVVAVSELYDNLFADELTRRLPVAWRWRDRGPKRTPAFELDGVSDDLLRVFSTRSAQVDQAMVDALATFTADHGRAPNRIEITRLRQVATRATRPPKHVHPLGELLATWRHRATTGGHDPDRVVGAVLHHPTAGPGWASTEVPDDVVGHLATATLEQVITRRSTWTRANVLAEAARQTRGLQMATVSDRHDLHTRVVDRVLARCVSLAAPEVFTVPAEYRRPDGTSVFTRVGEDRYTDTRVLDAESRLLAATGDRTAPVAPEDDVAAVTGSPISRTRHRGQVTLAADQREAVQAIETSGRRLDVLVGPAGTGKTTTLLALRRSWERTHGPGSVIGLATSATAAGELADALGIGCENTAKWLYESHGPGAAARRDRIADLAQSLAQADARTGGRRIGQLRSALARARAEQQGWALRPGQLLIVDEASLAGTFQLDALTAQATAAGAKVLLVGDHAQLSAVDAGGAFALLAERGHPATLRTLWRFHHPWEAHATLLLRAGNPRVLDTYDDQGRIQAGPGEVMLEEAYAHWRDSAAAGHTAILLAADQRTVDALNDRAHTDRVTEGVVAPHGITTPTGVTIATGDRVVTRHNARHRRVPTGGYVRNGDLWDVTATHPDGALTLTRVTRHDAPTGTTSGARSSRPAVRLDAAYVAAHVELGYATTTHRTQGVTVDHAHALAAPGMTRENLYVAMTRGRHLNNVYVAIDGVDPTCDALPDPHGTSPGLDILARILATSGAEISATQTLARAQDEAGSLHRLAPIHHTLATDAATRRWRPLLPTCGLDPGQVTALWASPERPALIGALRRGEARCLPMQRILTQLVRDHTEAHGRTRGADVDLATALTRALTEFLDAGRPTRDPHEADHVGPLEPIDPTDPAADPIGQLDALITARVSTLTALAIATHPAWMRPLDPEPDPGPEHQAWTAAVAAHVTHRDLHQLTEPGQLAPRTGPPPLALATAPHTARHHEARSIHR
ncbi:MobF family relaxase [Cellulomonas fimi]|uniref:Relaxase domain-containing protein n=1 Tax=Cellulomonas fimi TaxID=1708 RepID=A0A7Y0QGK4_CELFI|nr:MobF family relaxase [Cellulomonas fimi]NMR19188.1 relaxase domain-containing protein [Cellulomonas fimi]